MEHCSRSVITDRAIVPVCSGSSTLLARAGLLPAPVDGLEQRDSTTKSQTPHKSQPLRGHSLVSPRLPSGGEQPLRRWPTEAQAGVEKAMRPERSWRRERKCRALSATQHDRRVKHRGSLALGCARCCLGASRRKGHGRCPFVVLGVGQQHA